MNGQTIGHILIQYAGLLVLLTFHEFGHAWMAWKCGDDTAKSQGRCSLNPIVHIDPIGTVVIPLLMFFLSASGSSAGGFLVGWAKPVPVNVNNLKNPRWDDTLIALAGPWMNLILAVGLVALTSVSTRINSPTMFEICRVYANLSLMLCFFNLIPVPPLDGSHVARNLIGMSYETYWKLARFGFIFVIVVLQIPAVTNLLHSVTDGSYRIMAGWFGLR